ncbi:2-dehydro-3-deoxygalactonokinase [Catenovulum sediminis]|uniref:2-dehydro-3-deoxygalactonokinase n=1 Tax=Catenovulum sediminis TaxID=1740262 RepID=A0ABV1REF9_9ALTE
MNHSTINHLIIDWGTTNFRAFAINANGEIVSQTASALGLMQVKDGAFANALQTILENWLQDYHHLPVYMAGMIGSAQGWQNVNYVQAPATLSELASKTYKMHLPWGTDAYIVPGVSFKNSAGIQDVMRGEEVQLFGLAKQLNTAQFVALFPGTHSKHIQFNNQSIADFSTFMTGELYSLLINNSILGKNLPQQSKDNDTFMKGVIESQTNCLTNRLFATRTHRLFEHIKSEHVGDYLSGLLIGHEIRQLKTHHVYLVGSAALCERYQLACETLSKESTLYSGDECFLAGMLEIIEEIQSEK